MTLSMNAFKAAQTKLIQAGWVRGASVMHDGGATGNYGVSFSRDGARFFLNKDTIGSLPL